MWNFPRRVERAFGFIYTLCLLQACGQEPIKKDKITSSDGALIDCHDQDGVPNRIDPDCSLGQTLINASDGDARKGAALVIGAAPEGSVAPFWPACHLGEPSSSQELKEHSPKQTVWRNGIGQIKSQLLQEIHQEGLTQEKAVQLALVNNPDLFAYYENLELGYADLLEAGLRQNPVFRGSVRSPNQPGHHLNKLFDTAVSFLDFFLIPLRTRAAEAEIEVIESQVRQKVLDLVKEVEINWFELKTLQLELDKERKRVELKELAAELAALQRNAGNINALNARNREIQYEEAAERLKGLQADLEAAIEKMNRSLGLFGNEACWKISGEVDWKKDFKMPDLGNMEKAAVENRQDIEAIRREINAIAQKAKLKEWWTYSNLKVGVSSEREPEGFTVTGPSIELEIPVFNYGQGEKKKYDALLNQAQQRLLSKAVQACSEVREFLKTANNYRSQLEDLELRILPDFAKQITDAQAHYNVMTLGIYTLLDLKESEIQAAIEHIHALKHFIKAEIELLHAVGGSFAILRGKE